MTNEYESLINDYNELPIETKPLPKLENYPYETRIHNFGFIDFFFILFVIGVLVIGGFYIYMVYTGNLKDSISQEVNLDPNVTINNNNPITTNNENSFYLNATIIIQKLDIVTNST